MGQSPDSCDSSNSCEMARVQNISREHNPEGSWSLRDLLRLNIVVRRVRVRFGTDMNHSGIRKILGGEAR